MVLVLLFGVVRGGPESTSSGLTKIPSLSNIGTCFRSVPDTSANQNTMF